MARDLSSYLTVLDVRAEDEIGRKYTVVSLQEWDDPYSFKRFIRLIINRVKCVNDQWVW